MKGKEKKGEVWTSENCSAFKLRTVQALSVRSGLFYGLTPRSSPTSIHFS